MKKATAQYHIRFLTGYACGFAVPTAGYTGNWWWMALWLTMPIAAILELTVEKSKVFK